MIPTVSTFAAKVATLALLHRACLLEDIFREPKRSPVASAALPKGAPLADLAVPMHLRSFKGIPSTEFGVLLCTRQI